MANLSYLLLCCIFVMIFKIISMCFVFYYHEKPENNKNQRKEICKIIEIFQ